MTGTPTSYPKGFGFKTGIHLPWMKHVFLISALPGIFWNLFPKRCHKSLIQYPLNFHIQKSNPLIAVHHVNWNYLMQYGLARQTWTLVYITDCVLLQLIPINQQMHLIQSITSIKLLQVSASGCHPQVVLE